MREDSYWKCEKIKAKENMGRDGERWHEKNLTLENAQDKHIEALLQTGPS